MYAFYAIIKDDEISTACALLHDVVEDSDVTFDKLLDAGFPQEVIDVLKLLTHEKSVPYTDYVKKLSTNSIAKKVKIADLTHNSDISRLDIIDEKTKERCKKYKQALELLSK